MTIENIYRHDTTFLVLDSTSDFMTLWFLVVDRLGEHWLHVRGGSHTAVRGGETGQTDGGERDQR